MPVLFKGVCKVFAAIERTTKRLEMIDLLAKLFQAVKKKGGFDELDKIVYLATGRLLPDWQEAPKLGIADKMMIQVLNALSTASVDKIKQILVKKGDLGETAYYILHPKSPFKRRRQASLATFIESSPKKSGARESGEPIALTINDIYTRLAEISKVEGGGSQEQKLKDLRMLFDTCSAIEAKFLTRIITSTLRLGIAEMSVLDALAQAYTGDKNNRPVIEQAFNKYPDLGKIAQILYEKGLEGIHEISVQVGVPIKMMLASRMNYPEILPKLGGECISEYKLDGERLQIHKEKDDVTLFSRRLIKITDQYPDVVELVKTQVKAEQVIFEGEVVAMDTFYEKMLPFQVLSRRRRKFDVEKIQKEIPVALFVFDVLFLDSNEVMGRPLLERRAILEDIIKENQTIRLVTSKPIKTEEELVAFFQQAREAGTEGTMNKSVGPESIYKAGNRGFLWIKLKGLEEAKMKDTIDAVIVGASWGMGRRQGWFGKFLLAVYNSETGYYESFTKIGTGFSDDDLQQFYERLDPLRVPSKPREVVSTDENPDVWIAPQIVIEIAGDEITQSGKFDAGKKETGETGYSIRFPKFIQIREEKKPEDATTTKEIISLYKLQ